MWDAVKSRGKRDTESVCNGPEAGGRLGCVRPRKGPEGLDGMVGERWVTSQGGSRGYCGGPCGHCGDSEFIPA